MNPIDRLQWTLDKCWRSEKNNNIKANKFSGQNLGRAEKKGIAKKRHRSTVSVEMARKKPCSESLSHATAGTSSTQVADSCSAGLLQRQCGDSDQQFGGKLMH